MAKRRETDRLEEENQIAQMSQLSLSSPVDAPKSIIQTGPLFTPGIGDGLIKIINQLDPVSFLRLSRTCKPIHNFCYNTKGIQVLFTCAIVAGDDDFYEFEFSLRKIGANGQRGDVISEQEQQKLQNMPFTIVVKTISFTMADARILEMVRQLLSRFRRVVVEFVHFDGIEDWNYGIDFLQNYNVMCVHFSRDDAAPDDLLPFFLELNDFAYEEPVADDLILSATAKKLRLYSSRISKYTFMRLLQKFANEDIDCAFGRETNARNAVTDPFIEACSDVMKIAQVAEIDWENMEPSVLYSTRSDPRIFYLRKSDGSIGKLQLFVSSVHFGTGI